MNHEMCPKVHIELSVLLADYAASNIFPIELNLPGIESPCRVLCALCGLPMRGVTRM